jgi:hypothetical protein
MFLIKFQESHLLASALMLFVIRMAQFRVQIMVWNQQHSLATKNINHAIIRYLNDDAFEWKKSNAIMKGDCRELLNHIKNWWILHNLIIVLLVFYLECSFFLFVETQHNSFLTILYCPWNTTHESVDTQPQ